MTAKDDNGPIDTRDCLASEVIELDDTPAEVIILQSARAAPGALNFPAPVGEVVQDIT